MSSDTNTILEQWKKQFAKLFSKDVVEVNDEFIHELEELAIRMDSEYNDMVDQITEENITPDVSLNDDITLEEIENAASILNLGKSVGVDNIPNEILRNKVLYPIIRQLFNACFNLGVVPSQWNKSIICPILKPGKDSRDPYSYRSISLMSTVAKLFNSVLNNRLVKCLNQKDILYDEQNGFRKYRSCLDHIYSLCTILRNRKILKS